MPVFIPSWTYKEGVCYYAICLEGQGLEHAAWRRYREFDALHRQIKATLPGFNARPPPKAALRKMFASKHAFTATRAHSLQRYLRRLLEETWRGGRGASGRHRQDKGRASAPAQAEDEAKNDGRAGGRPAVPLSIRKLRLEVAKFILPRRSDQGFGSMQKKQGRACEVITDVDIGVQPDLSAEEESRLRACLQWVEAFASGVEGIFRLAGSVARQQLLYASFFIPNCKPEISRTADVIDVAGVLKRLLRERHESLLTTEAFQELMDRYRAHENVGSSLQLLPGANRRILVRLIHALRRISRDPVTKMSINNLARIFSPCLCPRSLPIQALLSYEVEDALATLFLQADPSSQNGRFRKSKAGPERGADSTHSTGPEGGGSGGALSNHNRRGASWQLTWGAFRVPAGLKTKSPTRKKLPEDAKRGKANAFLKRKKGRDVDLKRSSPPQGTKRIEQGLGGSAHPHSSNRKDLGAARAGKWEGGAGSGRQRSMTQPPLRNCREGKGLSPADGKEGVPISKSLKPGRSYAPVEDQDPFKDDGIKPGSVSLDEVDNLMQAAFDRIYDHIENERLFLLVDELKSVEAILDELQDPEGNENKASRWLRRIRDDVEIQTSMEKALMAQKVLRMFERADEQKWTLVRDKESVKTWYQAEEDTKTFTFLVQGPIDPPLINLSACLYEVDMFHNWFPFLKSAEELRTVSRFHKQIRVVVKAPWPIWNREVLADCFGVNRLYDGELMVILRELPEQDLIGLSVPGSRSTGEKAPLSTSERLPRSNSALASPRKTTISHRRGFSMEARDPNELDAVARSWNENRVKRKVVLAGVKWGGFRIRKQDDGKTVISMLANVDPKLDVVSPSLLNFIAGRLFHYMLVFLNKAASFRSDSKYAQRIQANPNVYEYIRTQTSIQSSAGADENAKVSADVTTNVINKSEPRGTNKVPDSPKRSPPKPPPTRAKNSSKNVKAFSSQQPLVEMKGDLADNDTKNLVVLSVMFCVFVVALTYIVSLQCQ